jgi:simple sugar transport system permease protein
MLAIGADVMKTYLVILTEPIEEQIGHGGPGPHGPPDHHCAGITSPIGASSTSVQRTDGIGILATTAIACSSRTSPGAVLISLAILAGAVGGAAWASSPEHSRRSFSDRVALDGELNYIAAPIVHILLRGPLLDPAVMTMGSGTRNPGA